MLKAILFILIIATSATAKSVYVNNKTGNDKNAGASPEQAFATLKKGSSQLRKSDTLIIANTHIPYFESLALSRHGGTPENPMVIEGNGAVISGLREIKSGEWKLRKNGVFFAPYVKHGALAPYLIINKKALPRRRNLQTLTAGSHCWLKEGVYFKPEKGKSISDYIIFGTILSTGFRLSGGSHIICRNLIAEYFSNDGFNIHGNCRGLLFQNIEGRYNGDDGFSIHEDVGAVVYNGYFHHNAFGIQNVNASRSTFTGALVENNRAAGVHFAGGCHSLVDSVVRNNKKQQIKVSGGQVKHLGHSPTNPMGKGMVFIKNVVATGGEIGLEVLGGSAVSVSNSIFIGSTNGLVIQGQCHMTACVIYGCGENEIVNVVTKGRAVSDIVLNYNLIWPCRIKWMDRQYTAETFSALVEQDKTVPRFRGSIVEKPIFSKEGKHTLLSPKLPPEVRKKLRINLGLTTY